jgi:hypothetical protein
VEAEFLDEAQYPGLSRPNPLPAEVEDQRRCFGRRLRGGNHPAADALPRLEDGHVRAGGTQAERCRQPGQSSPDDGEVRLSIRLTTHQPTSIQLYKGNPKTL